MTVKELPRVKIRNVKERKLVSVVSDKTVDLYAMAGRRMICIFPAFGEECQARETIIINTEMKHAVEGVEGDSSGHIPRGY